MNLQIFILSMFLVFSEISASQQRNITQIEFATFTRAYHKTIVIAQLTCKITEQVRGDQNGLTTTKEISANEWEKLIASVKDVSLDKISSLPSPSMKRATDAARISTITIATNTGETFTHTFDNENPNEVLQPLMTAIQQLSNNDRPSDK